MDDATHHTRPAMHGTQLRSLRAFYAEALSHLITSQGVTGWHYLPRLRLLNSLHPSAPADIQAIINVTAGLPLSMDSKDLSDTTAILADQARTAVEFASGREILAIDFKAFTAALAATSAPPQGAYLTMLQANAAAALDPAAVAPAHGYGIPEDAEIEIWVM